MRGGMILTSIALIVTASVAVAQMGTGRVTGSVKDPDGKPIVGATVTARDVESDRKLEATTDEEGHWALLGFRAGNYEFTITADGYTPEALTRKMQQAGRNRSIDVVLQPAKGQLNASSGGLLTEANALFDQKKYSEALAKYQEILAAQPDLYRLYYNIGSTYRAMGDNDKAMEAYAKVLEQEPLHTGTLVSMGDVLVSEGRLDEAVSYFEKAIDQTTDEVVPFNVAEIYMGQGNTAKAIQYYQVAAQRRPDWAEPYLKMGYAHLGAGDFDAASTAFQKVLEIAAADSPEAQQAQAALNSLASLKK